MLVVAMIVMMMMEESGEGSVGGSTMMEWRIMKNSIRIPNTFAVAKFYMGEQGRYMANTTTHHEG